MSVLLDVAGVNEKIHCIYNMDENDFNAELAKIETDFRTYVNENFVVDKFQKRLLDQTSNEEWAEKGRVVADALRNRYVVEAVPSARVKCPKIKITIELQWS